jgi:peptidyl-prolyl cis-trans isomerase SurA
MKKIVFTLLLLMPFFVQAQNDVLLEIAGDKKITLDEFKRIYLKNNTKSDEAMSRKAIEEYMDLFVNFKLKVYEAEKLGLNQRKSFTDELKKYRDQLAEPFLVDQNTSEQLYKEAYDRMFKAVRASHILFQLPPSAKPADTLAAYNKAIEIKKRIEKGEQFYMLAMKYSQDPSAKSNLGELGYFSAMRMVYPFESAAYNTPVGQISNPVQTQFGYHLVKVADVMDMEGNIDVQFIVVREKKEDRGKEVNTAKEKINTAYDSLVGGMTMERAVRLYTEDQNSLANNGLLANYEPGRMFPEFDSIAFRMETGTFSKPFYSAFNGAWFIVYVKIKHKHAGYAESLEQIKRKVSRMPHSYLRSKTLAIKLLAEYKNTRNEKAFSIVVDSLREMHINKRAFSPEIANHLQNPIFTVNDTFTVPQYEFLKFMESKLKMQTDDLKAFSDANWQEFIEKSVIKYEDKILHLKYPDFAYTVQEYHDGILLFNITDSLVWQKASIDTTGLRAFYNKTADKYTWNERAESLIITSNKPGLQKKIEKALKAELKKGSLREDFQERLQKQLKDNALTIRTEKATVEKGQNQLVDKTGFKKGLHTVKSDANEIVWCWVSNIVPPTNKKLNEVRGLVTAEYQNELEKQWIQSLRAKYKTEINKAVLETLIKE